MKSQTNFRIGDHYWRPCAEIMTIPDGKIYYVPVFDHLHADVQFDFPDEHYHLDGRFEMEPRMKQLFNCWDGHTAAVIVPGRSASYSFLSIAETKIKCIRTHTGLKIPDKPAEQQMPKVEKYRTWYNGFIGEKCRGKKCPHFGTVMLKRGGLLVCPMHGLTADSDTLRIIDPGNL
jgi:hypothetical protein